MPNFGYETAGASTVSADGVIWGTPATPSGAGTVTSVSVYADDNTNTVSCECGLYLSSTDALVGTTSGESAPFSGTASWQTFSWSGPSISAVEYTVSFWPDESSGAIELYYDATGSTGHSRYSGDIAAWPDPITWFNADLSERYSIYATYTASGSGPIGAANILRGTNEGFQQIGGNAT